MGGPIDLSLMETKEFEKVAKLVGDKGAKEFLGKSNEELKELIAVNSLEIQKATADTKGNEKYKAAVDVKKDLDSGLRDAVKPFKLTIALAGLIVRSRS